MASQEWLDKLERARDLLSHRIPGGDVVAVLDEALTLLVEKVEKDRFAVIGGAEREPAEPPTDPPAEAAPPAEADATTETAASPAKEPSRHIPNPVKRLVYRRDEGRCTFIDDTGRRCEATRFIEFHHLDPWGRHKTHDPDRITLRCRCHNAHAARYDDGDEHIDRVIAARRSAPG